MIMDTEALQALVTSTTNLLQPYLPIIASKITEKVGEEIPTLIKNLWEVIRKHFSRKPSAQESLVDLLKNPNDSDLQAAFRVQLRKLLEEDNEFAKTIKDIAENLEEKAKYISSQIGTENISIQGNGNILTQHQSGGITANSVVINNISANPTPVLQIKEIFINQFREGKYHSRFELSLITPHPVGNLYVGVRASEIEEMDVVPMRSGIDITGLTHNRDGYAFTNLSYAYGKYQLMIITEKPDNFFIEYNIE
jgi:hypothetical protein